MILTPPPPTPPRLLDPGLRCLQVLGGAGPAIAAVPLTVVWAGTSALSLLNNIRTRQVGPVGAVQRVGFVLFTGVGQIISAFSRMGAATMTYLPPNRTGHLTDRSLLTRAVQRPANAPDAFRSAFEEFCTGVLAGAAGTLLDPVQVGQVRRFVGAQPQITKMMPLHHKLSVSVSATSNHFLHKMFVAMSATIPPNQPTTHHKLSVSLSASW